MTSTVLDGVLCLLLISAAVVTVTTATPREPAGAGRAPAVASTLATTTTSANYTLSPPAEGADGDGFDRTAHGTLAELLSRAAVARIAVDGRRLSDDRTDLSRSVERAVRGAIRENNTRVTAVWRPHPGSSMEGRVVVGARPPPDVPVHAATVTASSGFPSRRHAARTAGEERGVDGVADVVADGVVTGLFPPERTRTAAGSSRGVSAVVGHRYRRVERRFGVSRSRPLSAGGVAAANERLAAAMSDRIADELRASNATATEIADGVRLDRVRITVRTWP